MTQWLERHRRSVAFSLFVLVLLGAWNALHLPVSLFPTIDFPRIAVNIETGDRPVERMVVDVTQPVEQALRSVPDVRTIRSTSSRGQADLSVSFAWGSDMVAAQLQMESALNRILVDLPVGTRFQVRRMDPTVFPVLGLTLRSRAHDLAGLRRFAVEKLQPVLGAIPGVAQVEVLGGEQAEYHVTVDPARLLAAGVTLDDVMRAVGSRGAPTAVGRLEDRRRLLLVSTDARLQTRDDVASLVVRADTRGAVRVRDVAQISLGSVPSWARVTAGGDDAVLINLRQSRGANVVALVATVRDQLKNMRASMPRDITVGTYYDQSELVAASGTSVRDAILIGAALSALVLLYFLRSLRLTLIVAIALPSALLTTVLLLGSLHMSFNIMTLGGLAAAVGLIVDDAVVVIEHMVRRLTEAAESPLTQRREHSLFELLQMASEVYQPLVGSSLATIVIFVPLAFIDGVTGAFFKALAVTMASTLFFSLLVAMLAVPLLTAWLADARALGALQRASAQFAQVRRRYECLAVAVHQRKLLAPLLVVVLLGAGAYSFYSLQTGFFPAMDEGGFVLDYVAPPGMSLSETDRLLRIAEKEIRATPDVDNYSRRTGMQLGGGLTEANEGDFFIHLKPLPRRPIAQVMSDIRRRIQYAVPGLQVETLQLMDDLIGDLTAVPQPVEVKLFGDKLAVLQAQARRIAGAIGKIPGIVEVQDGTRISGDGIELRIDSERAAIEGLDAAAVSAQLRTLIEGGVIGQVQSGARLIGIRLQAPAAQRDRIERLGEIRLHSPRGYDLPLSRIAEARVIAGQPQISRENLAQMVAVTARLEGSDLGTAMAAVRRSVRALAVPAGVRVDYGGLWAEQQKSFTDLAAVLCAGVLLVTALLLYLYERIAVVAAIVATVLLSMAAVLIGLRVTSTPLDISSLMGMTMIVGMVTEIAVFYFAEVPMSARPDAAALVHAGAMRLRPILMTTLIAVFALLPLALGIGAGSAMQTPLAIAIISGLVGALPLVLLVMPALFLSLADVTTARLDGRA